MKDISPRLNRAAMKALSLHDGFGEQIKHPASGGVKTPILIPKEWDDDPDAQERMAPMLAEMVLKDIQRIVVLGTGSLRSILYGMDFMPFQRVEPDMMRAFKGGAEAGYAGGIVWNGLEFDPARVSNASPLQFPHSTERRDEQIRRYLEEK